MAEKSGRLHRAVTATAAGRMRVSPIATGRLRRIVDGPLPPAAISVANRAGGLVSPFGLLPT